jgi:hypothetical protein
VKRFKKISPTKDPNDFSTIVEDVKSGVMQENEYVFHGRIVMYLQRHSNRKVSKSFRSFDVLQDENVNLFYYGILFI